MYSIYFNILKLLICIKKNIYIFHKINDVTYVF